MIFSTLALALVTRCNKHGDSQEVSQVDYKPDSNPTTMSYGKDPSFTDSDDTFTTTTQEPTDIETEEQDEDDDSVDTETDPEDDQETSTADDDEESIDEPEETTLVDDDEELDTPERPADFTVSNCVNPKHATLTFDDGPSMFTQMAMDKAADLKIPVSFFITGDAAEGFDVPVHQNSSHIIAAHSMTHKNFTQMTTDELNTDMADSLTAIVEETGRTPAFIRPPYGSYNDDVLDVMVDFGFTKSVMWSVDTRDWEAKDSDTPFLDLQKNVNASLALTEHQGKGQIVLCHDLNDLCITRMGWIHSRLISEGYEWVSLEECLGVSPYQ